MVRRAPGASEARVYDVSSRKAVPLHANLNLKIKTETAQKRARRKLEVQNTDTNLIQDFEFPTVSNRIKVSRNGAYLFASGTYPPQLHVYDTEQLSLKFKRHVDNDIIDFQILDEDWRKFVILSADRYLDFHSQFGSHYKTRVPSCGRDLMVHRGTAEIFVCGQGSEVWRFNLDQGRFLAPLNTRAGVDAGVNVCGISPVNSLLAFGGETGVLDVFDPRIIGHKQTPAGTLNVAASLFSQTGVETMQRPELTSVRFDDRDGVSLAVGTSTGQSLIYDLRSSHPLLVREQGNGLPIRSFRFHDDRTHCISADPKSIKVWNRKTGSCSAVVEPDADINHLCVIGASGVMCAAVEAPRVKTFYIPALGSAPRWCAFLDTFTEELEGGRDARSALSEADARVDDDEEVYENYKFVTKDELKSLGLSHLIGTNVLKAYMHGYFLHQKLYRRVVDVAEPFAYENYRKQKAREKIEAQRQSRITKVKFGSKAKRKVKVNQSVVDALQEQKKNGKRGSSANISVLEDERFAAMFSNADFAVNEESERYQFLNPGANERNAKRRADEGDSDEEYLERFELVDEGNEDQNGNEPKNDNLWSSEEDGESDANDFIDDDDEDEQIAPEKPRKAAKSKSESKKGRIPKMYEIDRDADLMAGTNSSTNHAMRELASRDVKNRFTLGERIASVPDKENNIRSKHSRKR